MNFGIDIIPFLLIILSLPVVSKEAENGTNWKVYATMKRHFQLEMVLLDKAIGGSYSET